MRSRPMNGSESVPLMPEPHDNHQHVRRVVLPSGKTIEVVYFEDQGVPMPEQLKRIFCEACDALGVEWTRMNAKNISVARRASVARLDHWVGPKE